MWGQGRAGVKGLGPGSREAAGWLAPGGGRGEPGAAFSGGVIKGVRQGPWCWALTDTPCGSWEPGRLGKQRAAFRITYLSQKAAQALHVSAQASRTQPGLKILYSIVSLWQLSKLFKKCIFQLVKYT